MGSCRAEVNEKPASPGGTGEPQKVPEQERCTVSM